MLWLHHKCELGSNSSTLHYWKVWLHRKLPVNFRHQTSYLSHVFRAVRIKSQFDIYFINIKQLNKILYAFFWVIPRRLNFICRRFGTLCLFHLHRQVGACRMNSAEGMLGYYRGIDLAWNWSEPLGRWGQSGGGSECRNKL